MGRKLIRRIVEEEWIEADLEPNTERRPARDASPRNRSEQALTDEEAMSLYHEELARERLQRAIEEDELSGGFDDDEDDEDDEDEE